MPTSFSFDDFWKMIPGLRKVHKKKAREVWDGMTDDQRGRAMQWLPAALLMAGEPQFFPHPFRWLRDERYDDECLQYYKPSNPYQNHPDMR